MTFVPLSASSSTQSTHAYAHKQTTNRALAHIHSIQIFSFAFIQSFHFVRPFAVFQAEFHFFFRFRLENFLHFIVEWNIISFHFLLIGVDTISFFFLNRFVVVAFCGFQKYTKFLFVDIVIVKRMIKK